MILRVATKNKQPKKVNRSIFICSGASSHCSPTPRDPITETENGFMAPKNLAFRFGDCTPLAHPLTFGEPGSLGHNKVEMSLEMDETPIALRGVVSSFFHASS